MKYLFIVNPMSGRRGIDAVLVPQIEQWAAEKGVDCAIEVTQYPRHATELVEEYAEKHEKLRVCACGGDGTVSETAAGAAGKKHVEMGVYPSGGGNDFIKCFGKQEDFLDFNVMLEGKSIPIDMMRINGGCCVNLMSVGIDADINHGTARYRKIKAFRGQTAYTLSIIEHLLKPMGKNMRVTVDDDVTLEGPYILAAVGNGQVYGGGYHATPEARLDDGLLDVVVIKKMNLLKIARVLGIYKKGDHLKEGEVVGTLREKVRFMRGKKVTISAEEELYINIDGECVLGKEIEISVVPLTLNVVLPPGITY